MKAGKTRAIHWTMMATGLLILAPTTQAAPPNVVCVPWDPNNLIIPHVTLSGTEITLKGTAHDPDGDAELDTYTWHFLGDPNGPSETGAVTDPYAIEARFAYVGDPYDMFSARLTVTDENGESSSDDYLVMIADAPSAAKILEARVNIAIDEGLWRLHKDQTRGTYGDGAKYGYWPYNPWSASSTGACTEAFEMQRHLPFGDPNEDPYVETVQRGLNYLLNQMHPHDIFLQEAGDPDENGNGIGLGCYGDYSHSMYECGITLMAFASSKDPYRLAETGDAPWVLDRPYWQIVQDMVDYLAFGQSDPVTGNYEGGWRYYANYGESDNSCSQWPVIGMETAVTDFNEHMDPNDPNLVTIPAFVLSELDLWIDYIQNDVSGGSGYDGPDSWVNIAKTGGLLCEMKLVGDEVGLSARVQQAVGYVRDNWDTDPEHFPQNSYYAFYSVMKGFRLLDPAGDEINALLGFDWYNDPNSGYAQHIVDDQHTNGAWYGGYYSNHPLRTAWALLTLMPHPICVPPEAHVRDDGLPRHPPLIPIQFDASLSQDGQNKIILYQWCFGDGDPNCTEWDNPDYESNEPYAEHAYPAFYDPNGNIDWAQTERQYEVTLRVVDDGKQNVGCGQMHALATCEVDITGPPWPPVADPDGPYEAGPCETIILDGSGSYDQGGRLYPDPNHPWHGYIVSWDWDLDNDGDCDDASGETVEWSSCTDGMYVVGLCVTNNFGDTTGPVDTVITVGNRPPVCDAGGPYTAAPYSTILLDASGSYDRDPNDTIISYEWDLNNNGVFNDPNDSTEIRPPFTVGSLGSVYIVCLRVTDSCGASSDCCTTVRSVIRYAASGTNLFGAGTQDTTILYDVQTVPPEAGIGFGLAAASAGSAAAGGAAQAPDFDLDLGEPGAGEPRSARAGEDRVSATEKGSLLVYPKVEIRWNSAGELIQDTFVTINNDLNGEVDIQMYFVSESCTNVDNVITLTENEPTYWSVLTGMPKGVSPWTVLGAPYPDPDGSGDMIMRGYVLAWAIDEEYAQIRWNHLYGGATIVNYADTSAWEYNAYAFQVVDGNVANGDPVGTAGVLNLDGVEYDNAFALLLLDFFASGSTAFSGGGNSVLHDTDLTLLIVSNDLRQDGEGPSTTKAKFDIWNENEVGFSGMEYCITKWDESLLSNHGGHFLVENLQTAKGRARITGLESTICPESTDQALLGVAAKLLTFTRSAAGCP